MLLQYSKCCAALIKDETTTLDYKNITPFIPVEVKASLVWERKMEGRRRIQTVLLTHNFFSWPYHAILSSRSYLKLLVLLSRGVLNRRPAVGCCSSGAPSHSRLRLRHSVAHVSICFNHFITPTHFRSTTWLLPLIFTVVFSFENLWLTARSRENMQHE